MEQLHQPSYYFDLGDPYSRHLHTEYNSLHDPYLEQFHKHNFQWLRRMGLVTRDGKVVCTLKEFNEYRQYLTSHRLAAESMARRGEERHQQYLAAAQVSGEINTFCLAKSPLQPQKPSCPSPPKSKKTILHSGQCQRVKPPLDIGYSQPLSGQKGTKLPRSVSSEADCKRKPKVVMTTESLSKDTFEPQRAKEAQHLEDVAEVVVQEVLEKVEIPQDQSVCSLRRTALGIKGSARRTEPLETSPPDHWQGNGLEAQELEVTILESLGKCVASSTTKAPEPGLAARGKEQPIGRGATQEGKCKELKSGQAEPAASNRAASQASLHKPPREVVGSVSCTLDSSVASQFHRDCSFRSPESLELARGNLSNRQPQPSQMPFSRQGMEEGQQFPRASAQQSLEASKGAKLHVLQSAPRTRTAEEVLQQCRKIAREAIQNAFSRAQQHYAKQTGCARTTVPEVHGTVKKKLERETKPNPTALAKNLSVRIMASQIVDSVLEQVFQPGPSLTPEQHSGRHAANLPTPQGGKESYGAEDGLPSIGPRFSRQPVPPVGPKPPTATRSVHVKLVLGKPQQPK